jgi:hypothetical protein
MCESNHVLLIQIECKCCHQNFFLCRSCYKGQIYCCEYCRGTAKKIAHRKAQNKYRTSEKGRKANKIAQRRRRIKINKKSVADRGSISLSIRAIMHPLTLPGEIKCRLCGISGRVVERFPRRGYRRTPSLKKQSSQPLEAFWPLANNPNQERYDGTQKNIGSRENSPDP